MTPQDPLSPERLLENAGWMKALARSLVVDDFAAEDIVQDTWLALLRRPPASPRAATSWLRRVVFNLATRVHRDENRRRRREGAVARSERADITPEELLERAEVHQRLVEAVTTLEEPYRSTVLLRFFEGLEPAQIARQQGVPSATVRSRLAAALRKLRARLDRRYGGDGRTWQMVVAPLAGFHLTARNAAGGVAAGKTGSGIGGTSALTWTTLGGLAMTKKMLLAGAVGFLVLGIAVAQISAPDATDRESADASSLRDLDARYRLALSKAEMARTQEARLRKRLEAKAATLEGEVARLRRLAAEDEHAASGEEEQPDQQADVAALLEALRLDPNSLWKLHHSRGDIEGLARCVDLVDTLSDTWDLSGGLSEELRKTYEQAIDFNGFRRGYVRFALGDFSGAAAAFEDDIETLDRKEGELLGKGEELSKAAQVYRLRSTWGLEVVRDLAGRPAPADFNLGEAWVTEKRVRVAESAGKTVAVLFRRVNDRRSAGFLRAISRFTANRPDTEFVNLSFLSRNAGLEKARGELAAELQGLDFQGAAGFDPDGERQSLFRSYRATVGTATFVILDRRGDLVWHMLDPHSENVRLAEALVQRASE